VVNFIALFKHLNSGSEENHDKFFWIGNDPAKIKVSTSRIHY
jgi:hypothetical protein